MNTNEHMNRVCYKLIYNPKTDEYTVERVRKGTIDISKVTGNVTRFAQYIWICRYKHKLEAHINIIKEERANNHRIKNKGRIN